MLEYLALYLPPGRLIHVLAAQKRSCTRAGGRRVSQEIGALSTDLRHELRAQVRRDLAPVAGVLVVAQNRDHRVFGRDGAVLEEAPNVLVVNAPATAEALIDGRLLMLRRELCTDPILEEQQADRSFHALEPEPLDVPVRITLYWDVLTYVPMLLAQRRVDDNDSHDGNDNACS